MASSVKVNQEFKEELMPIPYKFFQKIKEEKLLHLLFEASVTLIPKQDKEKENP